MAFTNVTVTGTFENPSGEPLNGTVYAVLSTVIQNGTTTVQPVQVSGQVTNGTLSMKLVANDDNETQPSGSYYTFQVVVPRIPELRFKAIVSHTVPGATVDISTLYKNTGFIGARTRPKLAGTATIQEIVEALVKLELVEKTEYQPNP